MRTFAAALFLVCSVAFGQNSTTGAVNITVVDASSAAVPDARLELVNTETNDLRTGATQGNGVYQYPALPFGTYRLTVSKSGFDVAKFESIQVETSRITDIRATLTVGPTSTTVEVNG